MSTFLVVMQPTFLPWAGYFNLMAKAEHFIFHDDVQLEKRSWQTRNRLMFNGKPDWVSVPIKHSSETQKIIETEVLIDKKWRDNLRRVFIRNYEHHPYFSESYQVLDLILSNDSTYLSELNEQVIRFIADKLGLPAKLHRSSKLGIEGVRSNRLIAFCEHFSVSHYLSPVGSADYLAADKFTEKTDSILIFQDYAPKVYQQSNSKEFFSHLSIIDVLANLGWDATRDYIFEGNI